MEAYLQQLVILLRGFAYVSMILALLHAVHDFRSGQNVTKYIVYLLCLTAFLAFYNQILDYGCQMFDQGVNEARQNTFTVLDEIGDNMVQKMFIIIFRVSAPLAIGLAAWRVFISTGVRFAAGTLWLCAWSLGCAIADILLLKLLLAILAKAVLSGTEGAAGAVASKMIVAGAGKTAAAAVGSAALWAILFALIIFLIAAIMIYILMPIALYHIICAGDVVQGATHAMAGAIGGGMALNRSIGRTFSGQAGGGRSASGDSGGGGNPPPAETASGSNTAGNSGNSVGNTRANRSHAALAESAERQLENKST